VKASSSQEFLDIGPYALPLNVSTIDVYGSYSPGEGISPASFGGVGMTSLGTYTDLSSLSFAQQASLNITSFVNSDPDSHFNILLIPDEDNIVGSNYDILSTEATGLFVTPEPTTLSLLFFGLTLIFIGILKSGRSLRSEDIPR
jgi:hypothetical protein